MPWDPTKIANAGLHSGNVQSKRTLRCEKGVFLSGSVIYF